MLTHEDDSTYMASLRTVAEIVARPHVERQWSPEQWRAFYDRYYRFGLEEGRDHVEAWNYAYGKCSEEVQGDLPDGSDRSRCAGCGLPFHPQEPTNCDEYMRPTHLGNNCRDAGTRNRANELAAALGHLGIPTTPEQADRSIAVERPTAPKLIVPRAADPANPVECRLWTLFAERVSVAPEPDTVERERRATAETVARITRAARESRGPWLEVGMTLPPAMVLVLLEWAEAIDATANNQRCPAPLRFTLTDEEHRFFWNVLGRLSNGPPLPHQIIARDLIRFDDLMRRARQSIGYRPGDSRAIRDTNDVACHPYARLSKGDRN